MNIVKRKPKPGEWIIAGKTPERAYIEKCNYVKDGAVYTTDSQKYPHDIKNVWVIEE